MERGDGHATTMAHPKHHATENTNVKAMGGNGAGKKGEQFISELRKESWK
jgi:hypothetical protein